MRVFRTFVAVFFVAELVVATPALRAQSFNIDVGVAGSVPSTSYGAATGQAGPWNVVTAPLGSSSTTPLVDVAGAATPARIEQRGGFTDTCATGTLSGDDGALLNDCQSTSGSNESTSWSVAGLAQGYYELTFYVYTPCANDHDTNVRVSGSGLHTAVAGNFTGTWIEGVTHVVVQLFVDGTASFSFEVDHDASAGGLAGLQIRKRVQRFAAFCTNGSLAVDHVSACPCSNTGALGNGCANSSSASGANLAAAGDPALNDVVLTATSLPATALTLFLQHDAVSDNVFHDGVLCASGTLMRLRGRSAVSGIASFPNATFPEDAAQTLAQHGGDVWSTGVRRYYSAWYRNAATTFCPPATANVTNGWIVDW